MTARDEFIEVLLSRGMMRPGEEWVIDANLRRYARELAAKQRNWDAEAAGYTDPQMAVYAAADLIDPEDD